MGINSANSTLSNRIINLESGSSASNFIMAFKSISVVFALAFLSSVRAYRHIPEDGVTFYTFNCGNENWCGVDQGNGLVDSSNI